MKLKKYLRLTVASTFIIAYMLISFGCTSLNKAEKVYNSFTEKWVAANYASMYEMLTNESKEYISEDDFISWRENKRRWNNHYSIQTTYECYNW